MNKTLVGAISALALASVAVQADVRVNGFANLVSGYTSDEGGLFGYDDKLDFTNESLFAVQVIGSVSDNMTATAQIIARGENDFDAEFEWAYLSYQVNDNLSLSAGRLRLPLFMYSESLDVGYSYHWINSPRTVYDIPFNNIDGVRASYTTYKSGWDYELQGVLGNIKNPDISLAGQTAELNAENTMLVSLQMSNDTYKARAVYGTADTSLSFGLLDNVVGGVSAIDPVLGDLLNFSEDTADFYGISFGFDNFEWFASAEYTVLEVKESFLPKDNAFYVTLGTRIGKFTPSVTYQKLDGFHGFKFLDRVAALPEQFQAVITETVVGIQLADAEEFDIFALGLRYDLDAQAALKVEIARHEDIYNGSDSKTLARFAVNYVF